MGAKRKSQQSSSECLGEKGRKKERGNKDIQGLQYYNVTMLQYCNAAISILQLPAISKWAN
jgi:hypothetical protein